MPDRTDWLWEGTPYGYVKLAADGRILHANSTLVDWLGLEGNDMCGRSLGDFIDEASHTVFDKHIVAALQERERARDVRLIFRTRTGALVSTRVRATRTDETVRMVIDAPSLGVPADAHELIHALQQTLIPPAPPMVPGLDVAAAYFPAQGEVGGDFYDVFEVADNDWCVVLGDVSGKGVDAAIVTAAARHAVRSAALREPVPSDLMRVLNDALIAHPTTRFCTVALARIHKTSDSWVTTLTTGGHPYPLLVRHGTATRLGRPGSLLGVFEDVAFHDVSIKLSSGDALALYTDGVVEARDAHGELFGEERLADALVRSAGSAQSMVDAVIEEVLAFQAGSADDIAIVMIRRP